MSTLEEKIKQMLAKKLEESTEVAEEQEDEIVFEEQVEEAKCGSEMKEKEDSEEVKVSPKKKEAAAVKEEAEEVSKQSTVSEQVTGLLSMEGLSEEFRTQAVAIFEAAVAERAMQIEEELNAEFEEKYEQSKAELIENIDGYLSEAVVKWLEDNQVAMVHSYKADLTESFIDGLRQLFVEHNVSIPEESESALDMVVSEVEALEAQLEEQKKNELALLEELNAIKRVQVLESFKAKMTNTEADRFVKLVEGIKFHSVEQFSKQLEIVSENFSVSKAASAVKEQTVATSTVVTESSSAVTAYADFLKRLNG